MKIKEINEKKSRIKEIKKEETEKKEQKSKVEEPESVKEQDAEVSEEGEIEQFVDDAWTKETAKENKPDEITAQGFTLEEVASDAPVGKTEETNTNTEIQGGGDFYSNKSENFYSNGNANDLYSSGNGSDLYGGGAYSNANGKNFYNTNDEEKIGEIRGEKISKLEMEGAKGSYAKDKRKGENNKYKSRSY